MEAKDTVIKIVGGARTKGLVENAIKRQAEISFKAGVDEAFSRYKKSPEYLLDLMKAKKEGIKEVFDFLHDNSAGIMMNEYALETKLKEWGFQPPSYAIG